MKEKVYRLSIIIGASLIVVPLAYMFMSLTLGFSYDESIGSIIMNSSYLMVGFTLIISFALNKTTTSRQNFWKLPAGILFVVFAFLDFLELPQNVNLLIFAIIITVYIMYSKYKKIL